MPLDSHRRGLSGDVWARDARRDGVEAGCGSFVEAVHEVAIAVDGDLDRGVAESGLDSLGVFAFCDEPCGVGVTQIVVVPTSA